MNTPPIYRLVLRSVPGGGPVEVRLRRLLKALLRGYGFRAIRIEQLSLDDSKGGEQSQKRSDQR